MQPYLLARTAYLCVSGRHVVILDSASGRYLGLPEKEAAELGAWVNGWPLTPDKRAEGTAPPTLLGQLRERGMLTVDPALGKPAEPMPHRRRDTWYAREWPKVQPRIRPRHVARIAWAVLFATCAKRWMRLDRILARARGRKQRRLSVPQHVGTEKVAELLQIYRRLRPFFYSTDMRCMFHCMALSEFLSGFDVPLDWVFGVRTGPFEAHCWLEFEGVSITDPPITLDRMTPIMVV